MPNTALVNSEPNILGIDQLRHYQIVAQAIAFISKNQAQQPTLSEIANAVHLSEQHLQRIFSAWAGISPKRFLQYLTKQHAKQALRHSADVLGAALASGLSGSSRLHDLMVSCEAMSPGEIKSRGKGINISYGLAATPFGNGVFAWTARGICYLAFSDEIALTEKELSSEWPAAMLLRNDTQAEKLANRIFYAAPKPGKLHLLLRGTNFQIKVWEALMAIPPSQLISYSQLAAMAGSPKAQRAVGTAMAGNTIGYLIPCHRVIRENGELGDAFRWGKDRKLAMQVWDAGQAETSAGINQD